MEAGHRLELLVEDPVIVELKSVERLEPVHELQLLTYLRLCGRWQPEYDRARELRSSRPAPSAGQAAELVKVARLVQVERQPG